MKKLFAAMTVMLLPACSSIIEGTSQEIVVNTNPPGALCSLDRDGTSIARIDPTPGGATIKKTRSDITVVCNKENYQQATYLNKSDVAAAAFGNILLGGLIGVAVDMVSGASNKYDSPVNITMLPTQTVEKNLNQPLGEQPAQPVTTTSPEPTAAAPAPVPADSALSAPPSVPAPAGSDEHVTKVTNFNKETK